MKRFKSIGRAIRRGHLKVQEDGVFKGVLMRRCSNNKDKWVRY